MTCIVGIQHNGRVHIGGDSAGIAGYSITARADQKVFTSGGYIFGFTSSFRMGQLLRYTLKPPAPKGNLDRFMVTTFIDAVRDCWDRGGFLTTKNGVQEGGTFLVGTQGVLYSVEADMQVCRPHDGYLAVGCGDDLALGSLHTTRTAYADKPRLRVRAALEAAAHHCAGVCPPFVIKATREATP